MIRSSFQRMLASLNDGHDEMQGKKSGIYIFGTGQGGRATLQHARDNQNCEIRGFFDNSKEMQGTVLDGVKVSAPSKDGLAADDYVLIASYSHQYTMYEQLIDLEIEKGKIIVPGLWLNELLGHGQNSLLYEEVFLYCPCCEKKVWVVSDKAQDTYYFCESCRSFPWHRALINKIKELFGTAFCQKILYEVAPHGSSSGWLLTNAGIYTASHYWPDIPFGTLRGNCYSQDLEALTFPDQSFDIVVTQVVFEHIFNPQRAFSEIKRVLKPGGYHIFTIPFFPGTKTCIRAVIDKSGVIEHLKEPVYHGNPISADGALVTIDWGDDIFELIYEWTGMQTTVYVEEEKYSSGVTAYSHLFISRLA